MAGQQAASTRRTAGTTKSTVTKAAPAKAAKAPAARAAKPAATKTAATRTAATKTAAAKTAASKTAASKTAAAKSAATKPAGTKTASARTPLAKPAAGSTSSARATARVSLPVRGDEKPWTAAELKAVRVEIETDMDRLRTEIEQAESELVGLMRDSGDGAGDDQADAGTKTYEREQEMSVAANAREMFLQNEHALERIADGSYGLCESCGKPIGKLRLQAAPRATLCLDCKKKQERR